jgi:hypothetical protein
MAYVLSKVGLVSAFQKRFIKQYPKPVEKTYKPAEVALRIPLVEAEAG